MSSRTTGSRCTAWWRTRSNCRWTISGRWARRRRSRCTIASRAGRALPNGADCRWPNWSSWSGPSRACGRWSFIPLAKEAEGGQFYDSLSMQNAMRPQTLLAYEMNFEPLNHLHGAPLRLRVENQLGFKMVKWIQAIEFVESVKSIYQGEGGYNEDHEYFGELANI